MFVDVSVLFKGTESLFVAGTLIIIAVSAKYLAAYIIQKIFKYSAEERNVIFGLSSTQAAATLAIVTIAFNLEMFNVSIPNGTIY